MPQILHFPQPGAAATTPKTPQAKLAIFGTFIDAPTMGELRIRRDTWITVDTRTGRIESISTTAPGSGYEVVTVGRRGVVVPGFIDCHVQYCTQI